MSIGVSPAKDIYNAWYGVPYREKGLEPLRDYLASARASNSKITDIINRWEWCRDYRDSYELPEPEKKTKKRNLTCKINKGSNLFDLVTRTVFRAEVHSDIMAAGQELIGVRAGSYDIYLEVQPHDRQFKVILVLEWNKSNKVQISNGKVKGVGFFLKLAEWRLTPPIM